MSGTQCPAVNGGSVHSSTATRGRCLPATAVATWSSRACNRATNRCAATTCPVCWPTVTMAASTSLRVPGSRVSTCARQPRWASAASTVPTSTAHTAHRSWVRIRSGSSSPKASASRRYRSCPAASRARTSVSIWAGVNPAVNVEVDTMRRDRAAGGKLHSKVTPTTSSPPPRAKRISVVEGSNDTIRTTRCYRPPSPHHRPADHPDTPITRPRTGAPSWQAVQR